LAYNAFIHSNYSIALFLNCSELLSRVCNLSISQKVGIEPTLIFQAAT